MRALCSALSLSLAIGAAVVCLPADAVEAVPPRIVTWNCSGCHGLDGNAAWPQVPRLAAQPAPYLQAQLAAFAKAPAVHAWQIPAWLQTPPAAAAGARNDAAARTFMVGPAQAIDAAEAMAAAAWYASRKAAPGRAGDPARAALGKELFAAGDVARGVLPCGDCHGAQAQGLGDFPRLAGQHADYLVRQLEAFDAGSRGHGSAMTAQARPLNAAQRAALGAYLQGL